MLKGEKLSATARAERSREATKQAMARDLLYAAILARIWPAVVMKPDPDGKSDSVKRGLVEFPYILAIDSPAGWLTWKLSPDEYEMFDWVPKREHHGETVTDKLPALTLLATDGSWTR